MPRWSRLHAKLSQRQIEGLAHADALGDRLDRAMAGWWRKLLILIRAQVTPAQRLRYGHHTAAHLYDLHKELAQTMLSGLVDLAHWGHASAIEPLRHAIAADTIKSGAVAALALREDKETDQPGVTAGALRFDVAALPEPARKMSKEQLWSEFKRLVFPPLTVSQVSNIVYSGNWQERLESISRLASPQVLATGVTQGLAAGETLQQIAKRVRPALENVRSSARRVARTEGMRVAHESQMQAWERLGPKLAGYQVHSALTPHTRSWHALRTGTIYYKNPEAGQKGMHQMPRPPLEADDENERPILKSGKRAPKVACNCLCYLSPVMTPIEPHKLPIFTTAQEKLVPDPAVYSEWFERASVPLRKKAVGVRRYNAVEKLLGEPPTWENFLDPDTGDLLHQDWLRNEPGEQRAERVAKVRELIRQRRHATREVATFGFLRPGWWRELIG